MLRIARNLSNYFRTFPKTTHNQQVYNLDLKQLKNEYKSLQKLAHPDKKQGAKGSKGEEQPVVNSHEINKAYSVLKSPFFRAVHILQLNGIDLEDEQTAKRFGKQDKQMLFQVLEIFEELESVNRDEEYQYIIDENNGRIEECYGAIEQAFEDKNYEEAANKLIQLKYWLNIKSSLDNRVPGEPIQLLH